MKHVDLNPILDGMVGRRVPGRVKLLGSLAVLLGLGGFAAGLALDPAWAWGAYLTALLYTLAIAQGGVLFAAMLTLTWGRWGRPLKRMGEAVGFFLPLGYLLLLVFLLLGNGLYPWHEGTFLVEDPISLEPHNEWAIRSKPIWLNLPFFIGRQILGVGVLVLLDFLYIRASLRPDLVQTRIFMRQKHPDWQAPGWWALFAGSPQPIDIELKRAQRARAVVSPMIAILYAFVFSMLAFDLIMSLSPWWYANMFGAWFFASSFWLALAFLGIYGLLSRDWLGIRHLVNTRVTHDIGKLTLAFCMFWAYTFFAMLLPIWYANMPEETDFLLIRMYLPQWAWMAKTVGVLCFLTPFTVLVSRGIKKMKWPFIGILAVIMVGLFLERTLLVMPAVHFGDTFPVPLFLGVSLTVWVGFLGLLVLVTTWAMSRVPPVGVSDPRLHPHPWDVHVRPIPRRRKEREASA
jgi:hypothetical protein